MGDKLNALEPGESKTVKFTLNPEDYSFVGRKNKRIIEAGEFKIAVSGLS